MRFRGLTLIEILVVIVIIATLSAMLFPVFVNSKMAAKRSVCLSHEKQIGLAMTLYAGDYDDMITAANSGQEELSDGLYHDISWISVLQPYAERVLNVDDRGKSKTDLDSARGVVEMFICPSQDPDPRAAYNSAGILRMSSGGVGVTYGLATYANSARCLDEFHAPSRTILAAEQYLNFTMAYYYPVDYENVDGYSTYGARMVSASDCRFDRPVACTFSAGTFPARPEAMPGMDGLWLSNLGSWHGSGQNFLFVDGHARYQNRRATYSLDGSFSEWTISNRWERYAP